MTDSSSISVGDEGLTFLFRDMKGATTNVFTRLASAIAASMQLKGLPPGVMLSAK